jgi:hypothetical protein
MFTREERDVWCNEYCVATGGVFVDRGLVLKLLCCCNSGHACVLSSCMRGCGKSDDDWQLDVDCKTFKTHSLCIVAVIVAERTFLTKT